MLCFIAGMPVKAQQDKDRSVKLYTNFRYSIHESHFNPDTLNNTIMLSSDKGWTFGNFTPAYQWTTENGQKFEVELTQMNFGFSNQGEYTLNNQTRKVLSVNSGARIRQFQMALRLEKQRFISTDFFDGKFRPMLASSIEPFFTKVSVYPHNSSSFHHRDTYLGLSAFFIPRFNYELTEKFYFDLNIPIHVITLETNWNVVENPAFSAQQQRITSFSINSFSNSVFVRLGAGIRI